MHPVLLLPELLMEILSFLPSTDLSKCFSVSRSWHTILLANLPARLRPLPDPHTRSTHSSPHAQLCSQPQLSSSHTLLPQSTRDIAQSIQIHAKKHLLGPFSLLSPSDDYFFWQEAVHSDLLQALLPHIHPILSQYAYSLTGGISDVAKGEMGIWIRTRMRPAAFEALLDMEEDGTEFGYLTQPFTNSVEVRCLDGAVWNTEYGNVQRRRGDLGWVQRCIMVERERGVRMCDVVEELRGVLKADKVVQERGDGSVLLEWRMGCYSTVPLSFEAFDRTG